MLTVIITVTGTIVVALVGVIASRVDTRDRRKRLRQDVDLVKDLPTDSPARRALEKHINWSVDRIVRSDRNAESNRQLGWSLFWLVLNLVVSMGLIWILAVFDFGGLRGSVIVVAVAAFASLIWQVVYLIVSAIRAHSQLRAQENALIAQLSEVEAELARLRSDRETRESDQAGSLDE